MAPNTAVVPFEPQDPESRIRRWVTVTSAERHRMAAAACQERDRVALGELLAGYLLTKGRARAQTSDHTIESYGSAVAGLLDVWGEESLLHPSPDAGDRFASSLSTSGARPATVAARLAGAKALYRALRWSRATDADPFADVHAPRDPTPRHERRFPYSEADIQALLEAAKDQDRVLVLLCAHGGLRIAEALALRCGDVDLQRGQLRVAAGKGRKARTVSLSRTLMEALREHAARDPERPVIGTASGLPYADPTVPRRQLKRLCEAAGVRYLGFHSLRHSAGTRLARQTGNLQLVAAHLGHADVSTASVYAKWSDDTLRQAVHGW